MLEIVLVERLAGSLILPDRLFKRPRIPERDRRDDQVQPARPLLEILDRAVLEHPAPMEADGPGQRVPRLALVQPDGHPPA